MDALEKDLRRVLQDPDRFPIGSVSFVEPGLGATHGLPDTFVLVTGRFTPLELKRGLSVVKELRPTQRLWHKSIIIRGASSFGAAIAKDGSVRFFQLFMWGRSISSGLGEEQIAHLPADVISQDFDYDKLCRILDYPQNTHN